MLLNIQINTITMKKTTVLFASLLAISAISYSFISKPSFYKTPKIEKAVTTKVIAAASNVHDHVAEVTTVRSSLYDGLKLNEKGLSKNAVDLAVKGYLSLQEQGKLKNTDLITIVDFSQSSRKKRFYLLDVKNKKLLENTYVAHGKNSGVDMATDFSNTVGSEKSSIGFYVTKGTYTGKNGFSLRMKGLDQGFNDNAEERAIVVHGAGYVNASRVQSSYMGRSQGCPALPRENYVQVIDQIKNGTLFFVYYPSKDYLKNSTVLNS